LPGALDRERGQPELLLAAAAADAAQGHRRLVVNAIQTFASALVGQSEPEVDVLRYGKNGPESAGAQVSIAAETGRD
jgi:hypothetical protein